MVLDMGRSVEKSGRTVNDAIAAALEELNLSVDDVHVDVLNEGKTGLFGLISSKPARVRVSELDEDERMPQPGYLGAASGGAARADAAVGGGAYGGEADFGEEDADSDEGIFIDDGENGDMNIADDEINLADGDGEFDGGDEGGDGDSDGDGEAYGDGSGGGGNASGAQGAGDRIDERAQSSEQEIGRAVAYLGEIFNGIHVSVNMETEPTEDGFAINIESEDSGILIGHRGETLDAIQYLLNLYINKGRNAFTRVTVDVENYKKKREAALVRLAGQMADKVVRLRRNFTMDAMNSYERRIIHSTLQSHPRVETYSVGEEPNRKVVVTMKNRGGYSSR